jgi:DNA-binding LacI/PurR family transcriptional regulator
LDLEVLQVYIDLVKHVPGDISVAGFDDIPEASRSQPPLITVRSGDNGIVVSKLKEWTTLLRRI